MRRPGASAIMTITGSERTTWGGLPGGRTCDQSAATDDDWRILLFCQGAPRGQAITKVAMATIKTAQMAASTTVSRSMRLVSARGCASNTALKPGATESTGLGCQCGR